MKQILHLVPFQNLIFLLFDIDLLFPRIRALQATFKAVLIAVYMTNGLQTKCKTCFWGPKMIGLGHFLEFLGSPEKNHLLQLLLITLYYDSFESSLKGPNPGKKKVYIKEQKNQILEWDQM